jgi:hypothetical protein
MKAAICVVCHCSVDTHEDHAIVRHEYAHLDCADAYDSRDLGGMDLPPYVEDQYPEQDEEDHGNH